MTQTSGNQDLYLKMREQGYKDNEIRSALQPMLEEGGFSDQEINTYFKAYDPVSMLDAIKYGFQGSVTGLAVRGKMPDALTEKQVANAGRMDRLAIGAGQMAGDMPTIVGGGLLGLLGGPSAPITVPATAFAITEANRAMFMEQIKNGEVQNGEQFARRMGMIFTEAAKGAVIGGATGGMGKLAGMGAKAAGMGAIGAETGTIAAEVVTMPTAAAGLEGRLPHAQEFVDAALFIASLRGGMGTVRNAPKIVPTLRDIYAKIGKPPLEVAEAAQKDATVRQDLFAANKDIPDAFIADIQRDTIYNDARTVKFEFTKTDVDFSITDRAVLRTYLEKLDPLEIKALKFADPTQYLHTLKVIVDKCFPDGGNLRFRTQDGVYDYEHLLTDTTRRDYIATLPKTLKDKDIGIEFSMPDGEQKAYYIKKYFDIDLQKDIWDVLVIRDGELKTKIARKARRGSGYVESTILGAGDEASQPATAAGNSGSAPPGQALHK